MARWVFPLPGGPTRITFSARSRKWRPASSLMRSTWRSGSQEKSKLSRVRTTGNLALAMRALIERSVLAASSSCTSPSRKAV